MSNFIKSTWPVQTFKSHIDKNYNTAISYYEQKKTFFIASMQGQVIQKFQQLMTSGQSLDELIQQELDRINNEFIQGWQSIYNKKYNLSTLKKLIQQWAKNNQIANSQILTAAQLFNFIDFLSKNAGGKGIGSHSLSQELSSVNTISMQELTNLINMNLSNSTLAPLQFAGNRGRVLGEIFEQGVGLSFQSGVLSCLNTFKQIGGNRVQTPFGITQGKTDIIFSSLNLNFTEIEGVLSAHTNLNGKRIDVPLDGMALFDLEGKNVQEALKLYINNTGAIGGISAKQWTENIIGMKRASTSRASMGNFALTAQLYNTRWAPNQKKISWVFDNSNTATLYGGYLASKFLINIIGLYNIFMATGSQVMFTDQWLKDIKNRSYVVSNKLKNGYIESTKDTTTKEKAYYAVNGLVLAYTD